MQSSVNSDKITIKAHKHQQHISWGKALKLNIYDFSYYDTHISKIIKCPLSSDNSYLYLYKIFISSTMPLTLWVASIKKHTNNGIKK